MSRGAGLRAAIGCEQQVIPRQMVAAPESPDSSRDRGNHGVRLARQYSIARLAGQGAHGLRSAREDHQASVRFGSTHFAADAGDAAQ